MDVSRLIQKIKSHPRYSEAGMILIHNGVVRKTSRNGKAVTGLSVSVDHTKLREVIATYQKRPGILEILVEIAEDRVLSVGDDVMLLVVAGDIRGNVIQTLSETLDAIKSIVTRKTEFFQAMETERSEKIGGLNA
ncbi:MAG: molybdenum cofactor biosynthesis protein MoaE [Desulfobacterales bacterium CG07_land_8_20_14_0_80_52_14]|nr:MAG: molybdenum cofactor biosynthesis protein MoaE [Desulfobacterales bacterium CG23_combo_of_CG06-09_8_20_14_all_52_9]PIU49523.1 MAG: molybdenum cofactor biosynthesis protein MoaE [Desulfobacterales bacterium CG07_land_8_20_14_0_80_52_14]